MGDVVEDLIDQIEELETKLSAANDLIGELQRELTGYELEKEHREDR